MLSLVTVAGLAALLHALLLLRRARALAAYRVPPAVTAPVSVLVAARNEAASVPALLAALAAQDYPRDAFSVILVDDRSTDDTGARARDKAQRLHLPLTVLRVSTTPDGFAPKKWALQQAIEAASSEHLLFTDADCRPAPQWMRAMVSHLEQGADLVAGLGPLEPGSSAASRWAAQEARRTMLAFVGEALVGRPYMAVGRNWALRRSLFLQTGGYGATASVPSGDDDLLFQRLIAQGARPALCLAPESSCPSPAPSTWTALLRQKRRHASVGARYPLSVLVSLTLQWLLPVLTLVVLGISLFAGQAWARFASFCFAFAACGGSVVAADAIARKAALPSPTDGLLTRAAREAGLLLAAPFVALWGLTGFRHWKDG